MITFRCTARVRKRFSLSLEEDPPPPTARLGDWYTNLLNFGNARWVLCLSELSLLPVVVPARNADFPSRFPEYLRRILVGIGVPAEVAHAEANDCSEWRFGKTASRSILGSMNDFVLNFQTAFYHGLDAEAAAIDLAGMPCGPLNWRFPNEAARQLLDCAGGEHPGVRSNKGLNLTG